MCRWAAYTGAEVFLEDIISTPAHSLIAQSQKAVECKTATNGDGFGIAWYGQRPEPGLYRDVYPAWSDCNLRALVHQVQSGLFLGHVRASTGSATSRNNCHPFTAGKWSFMHNGQVGGFEKFRRHADMSIPDELYEHRRGATDSEVLFLLALQEDLDADPKAALERAVGRMEALSRARGTAPHMRLSVAMSDGQTLFAARYSSDAIAPSVYYRWSRSLNGWAVVSEPFEHTGEAWSKLRPGEFLTLTSKGAETQPFQPFLADV